MTAILCNCVRIRTPGCTTPRPNLTFRCPQDVHRVQHCLTSAVGCNSQQLPRQQDHKTLYLAEGEIIAARGSTPRYLPPFLHTQSPSEPCVAMISPNPSTIPVRGLSRLIGIDPRVCRRMEKQLAAECSKGTETQTMDHSYLQKYCTLVTRPTLEYIELRGTYPLAVQRSRRTISGHSVVQFEHRCPPDIGTPECSNDPHTVPQFPSQISHSTAFFVMSTVYPPLLQLPPLTDLCLHCCTAGWLAGHTNVASAANFAMSTPLFQQLRRV